MSAYTGPGLRAIGVIGLGCVGPPPVDLDGGGRETGAVLGGALRQQVGREGSRAGVDALEVDLCAAEVVRP